MSETANRITINDYFVCSLIRESRVKSRAFEKFLRAVDLPFNLPRNIHRLMFSTQHRLWSSLVDDFRSLLEELDLRSGHCFLMVGVDAGFMNMLAGTMLGAKGLNYGIDENSRVVYYANKKANEISTSDLVDTIEFCKPKFLVENEEQTVDFEFEFDRICHRISNPSKQPNIVRYEQLLKIGGVLVLTSDNGHQKFVKTINGIEGTENIDRMFNPLPEPKMFETKPFPKLDALCRIVIRNALRNGCEFVYPEMKSLLKFTPADEVNMNEINAIVENLENSVIYAQYCACHLSSTICTQGIGPCGRCFDNTPPSFIMGDLCPNVVNAEEYLKYSYNRKYRTAMERGIQELNCAPKLKSYLNLDRKFMNC